MGKGRSAAGDGDGQSHRSGWRKPLKTTELHFPGLNTSTESLHSNTAHKISSETFCHTEMAWFLFFFLFK